MRTSLDEVLSPAQKLPAMSAEGPSNPLGNRPRMAEALASLKEGLRDTADPLYDGWKLQRPASGANERGGRAVPPAADPSAMASPQPGAQERLRAPSPPAPPVGETIDISWDGTPDATPISEEPPTPVRDPFLANALPTEEAFFTEEVLIEPDTPPPARRPSVQTDTVRVRVIGYQAFPRWALIVAAALFVFAASLLILRMGFPHDAARSTRSAKGAELAPDSPTSTREVATAPPIAAPSPAGVNVPSIATAVSTAAAPAQRPTAEGAASLAPLEPAPAVVQPNPSAVPPSAPAAKMPGASSKRRTSAHDFFRDPGF